MTYVLHKYYSKTGPPTETIAANSLKNAKIRAYRIAMRDKENLDRIGIETLAKSHNTYHAIKIFVRYADGKVWYTSGKTKKQLLSNGEFATDVAKKSKEDIFAWFTGGEPVKKPKTVAKTVPKTKKGPAASQFLKDHIIIARPGYGKVTTEEFVERFQGYYEGYLHGKVKESGDAYYKWVEEGDKLIKKNDPWVARLIKNRPGPMGMKGDPLTSDREVAAFARTYYYYKKKGMI